jgi:hypothetical protein
MGGKAMTETLNAIIYFCGCLSIAVVGIKAAEWSAAWVLNKLGNPPENSQETYFRRQVERPYAGETDSELERDLMQTTDDLDRIISVSVGLDKPDYTVDASIRSVMRERRKITIEEIIRREARMK